MSADLLEPVQRRLRSVAGVTDDLAEVISGLPFRHRSVEAGELLYSPGATALPFYILLGGSATRFKLRHDGSRAVVAFDLPGDIVNVEALLLRRTDCGSTIAARGAVAVVDREALASAWRSAPGLEAALWRYALVKSAALEEWLLNIGKRPPIGRIAHLLMEVRSRLLAVTSSDAGDGALHITDRDVADAIGTHEVIATRLVGELCSRGVVRREAGAIVVVAPEQLAKIGEFQPDYLHMAG